MKAAISCPTDAAQMFSRSLARGLLNVNLRHARPTEAMYCKKQIAPHIGFAVNIVCARPLLLCTTAMTETHALSEEISIAEKKEANSRIVLTVTVPAVQSSKAWARALKNAGSSVQIPGFRKGKKVAESVLLQHFKKEDLIRDAVEVLLTSTFDQAVSGHRKHCFGDSFQIVSDPEKMKARFDKDKSFTYQIAFDVQPTMTWKGDYKKIKVDVSAAGNAQTDRVAAQEKIASAIKEKGRLSVVTGRGLQTGDVAIIDFEAFRTESGEAITGTQRNRMQLDTSEPENSLGIPGIVEDLVGMQVGDTRTVKAIVPDTWWEVNLRGTSITCSVNLKELFLWNIPELTDEVAKQLLKDCSGVLDLQQKVLEAQTIITASETANKVNKALTAAVSNLVEADIPAAMVREIATNDYQANLLEMQTKGALDPQMLDQLATEEMLDKYISTRREELTEMTKGMLGFENIFEEQNLNITEDEVKKEAQEALGEAAQLGGDLDEEKLLAQVYEVLKATKVLAWLTDNVSISIHPSEAR